MGCYRVSEPTMSWAKGSKGEGRWGRWEGWEGWEDWPAAPRAYDESEVFLAALHCCRLLVASMPTIHSWDPVGGQKAWAWTE